MKIIPTSIADLCIIEPTVFGDNRGYFMESFKQDWFDSNFPGINLIQDNESKSSKDLFSVGTNSEILSSCASSAHGRSIFYLILRRTGGDKLRVSATLRPRS